MLRREIKRRLSALAPEQFYREGLKAAAHISSDPGWLCYPSVLLFLSTNSEIDTQPLLENAFSGQKKIFVPKIEDNRICFYRIFSPGGPWRQGPFSIREPAGDTETLKPEDGPLLVIVPGLAFDQGGNRLGRGGGYYDRFFSELDKKNIPYSTIGLCTESQIVPRIPREGWDKSMDALCTGEGLTPCCKKI
ncbi:MAG: 5-formyltetrahydrofolate cyclo-ligase [Treponema sp.]|nr:5-formyltetrahydrofolate cyclo-ligase [Treponema sp.]